MSYNPQNPNGQATSANSTPVVIASDQSAVDHNLTKVNGSAVATAASGIAKVGLTDGTGNAITSTSNALDINIKSGGATSSSTTDAAAWTASSSAFSPTGGVFNDSATALTSGQQGTARLTNNRGLHTNLRNASGTEIATSSNPLRVDPTGSTTQPISGTVSVNALPAGTNNIGGVELIDSAGTNKASISAGGAVKVDGSASTQPVSGTVTANVGTTNGLALDATLTGGTLKAQGNVASAATDSGNPVKVGGVYNSTLPTFTNGQRGDLQLNANGGLILGGGTVASGATDANNPIKVGGVYHTTAPTFTDGQRGDLQLDNNGNVKDTLATLIAGEDLTANVMKVEQRFSYASISTATTTTVKSGAGFLHTLSILGGTAGAITVYDNTAGSGTTICATFTPGSVSTPITLTLNVSFGTGLTIVTGAATVITVSYR